MEKIDGTVKDIEILRYKMDGNYIYPKSENV